MNIILEKIQTMFIFLEKFKPLDVNITAYLERKDKNEAEVEEIINSIHNKNCYKNNV